MIDESPLRRGSPSAPSIFGNRRTILGGDFLLGRAISLSAGLRNYKVSELIARVISTLVEGEFRQAADSEHSMSGDWTDALWNSYLEKTYMKTASLFSDAMQAAVLLWGPDVPQEYVEAASVYGRELGMAFQVRVISLSI